MLPGETPAAAPAVQNQSNLLGDPTRNLRKFTLNDLFLFTKEGS